MNLKTNIRIDLWDSIKKNYESESYSESILDAIYHLNNMIRDKTGLESDGVHLMERAFGIGNGNPKIKVNDLQTESDENEQEGILFITKGLMKAIRNPRSHDRYEDDIEVAEAIIIFINYLICVINESDTPFSKQEYLKRLFDPNFVENKEYAELLVDEIPIGKRYDILVEVYEKKYKVKGEKLKYFLEVLLDKLEKSDIDRFYQIVSEEMKYVKTCEKIKKILKIIPIDKYWNKIDRVSRMRIEDLLLSSIEKGKYNPDNDSCIEGSLATIISGEICHLTEKEKFAEILINKVETVGYFNKEYVLKYFYCDLFNVVDKLENESKENRLKNAMRKEFNKGNQIVYNKLLYYNNEINNYKKWKEIFQKEFFNTEDNN